MNKVIIVGKAASGKDHMRRVMESRGFTYGVPYTTRPPREGEVEGVDYYFISNEQFKDGIENNFWYEWANYNNWYYGISHKQFKEDCNLFIMTPKNISCINPIDRKECTIIYLNISTQIRCNRLSNRNMPGDSTDRRIEADEQDFADFTDFDIQINNHKF